jgi:hypothetical protein
MRPVAARGAPDPSVATAATSLTLPSPSPWMQRISSVAGTRVGGVFVGALGKRHYLRRLVGVG